MENNLIFVALIILAIMCGILIYLCIKYSSDLKLIRKDYGERLDEKTAEITHRDSKINSLEYKLDHKDKLKFEQSLEVINKISINGVNFDTVFDKDGLKFAYPLAYIYEDDNNKTSMRYRIYQYRFSTEILNTIIDKYMEKNDFIKISSDDELYDMYKRMKNIEWERIMGHSKENKKENE